MGWFKRLSIWNLIGLAGFVGAGGGVLALTAVYHKRRQLTQLPFRSMAIDILHKNKPALQILGEPIEIGEIQPGDRCNFASSETGFGSLKIPLKGTTRRGDLYVLAKIINKSEPKPTTDDGEIKWCVNKVELHLEGALRDKTFIIFKTDDNSLS